MYAVIDSGGQQLRVQVGDVVHVARRADAVGEAVVFDRVLLVGGAGEARTGTPTVPGAVVRGVVVGQDRDRRLLTFIYKKRNNSGRRRRGHRQAFTAVKIEAIDA